MMLAAYPPRTHRPPDARGFLRESQWRAAATPPPPAMIAAPRSFISRRALMDRCILLKRAAFKTPSPLDFLRTFAAADPSIEPGGLLQSRKLETVFPEIKAGGFSRVDGTIAFYTRVQALCPDRATILDFGAGRGKASEDPSP
jgi:hypothetical protein